MEDSWRISGGFIDGQCITMGIGGDYTYNVENMKEYGIADKFEDIDPFE